MCARLPLFICDLITVGAGHLHHLHGNPDIIQIVAKAKNNNPGKDIQIEVDNGVNFRKRDGIDIAIA